MIDCPICPYSSLHHWNPTKVAHDVCRGARSVGLGATLPWETILAIPAAEKKSQTIDCHIRPYSSLHCWNPKKLRNLRVAHDVWRGRAVLVWVPTSHGRQSQQSLLLIGSIKKIVK